MTVQKLIEQYEERVKSIDVELYGISLGILHRRGNKEDYAELLEEKNQLNDKRQIYYQVVKDLEDLL